MKLRLILPLLLTASTAVSADEYQTFVGLDYSTIETPFQDSDRYSLGAKYYFDTKSTLGPLAEFKYINTTSNIFGGFSENDGRSNTSLGGEYFNGNFSIGTSFNSADDDDLSLLTVGYLINDDFIIKVHAGSPFGSDSSFAYQAQYNHQLDGSDYLGFSFITNDDFDYQAYSATYFKKLEGQSYLKAELDYHDGDGDSYLSTETTYYFNKMTSVSLMLDEDSNYGFGANHFFNESYSIGANYSSAKDYDYDVFHVNFSARF